MILKKFIPQSLLGRSIIIIFVPIIVLVLITSIIFYQTSWNIISKRLTQSVVADLNVIVKLIEKERLINILPEEKSPPIGIHCSYLEQAKNHINIKTFIDFLKKEVRTHPS